MRTPTVSILCVARNEPPFIEEWLEYHLILGFDRIHLVSTDDSVTEFESFANGYRFAESIELYHFDDFRPGWQVRCYNACLPFIKEDWLLVMDVDEFLYLSVYQTIQDFLDAVPGDAGQVQLPWLNVLSDSYFHECTFDVLNESKKYVSNHVKSLVRREHVSGLGIHSHKIHGLKNISGGAVELPASNVHQFAFDNPGYYEEHPFVLHFFSRGHLDVLNRIIDHRFFNAKNGPIERQRLHDFLTGDPNWTNIPTKCLMMHFYRTFPTVELDLVLPDLKAGINLPALRRIFLDKINRVVEFDSVSKESLEHDFEARYLLAHKLAIMDLPEVWSHDDYFECGTQLEYIKRLRNLLTSTT